MGRINLKVGVNKFSALTDYSVAFNFPTVMEQEQGLIMAEDIMELSLNPKKPPLQPLTSGRGGFITMPFIIGNHYKG